LLQIENAQIFKAKFQTHH